MKKIRTIAIASTFAASALFLSACSTATDAEPLAKSDTSTTQPFDSGTTQESPTESNGWNAAESSMIADYEYEFGPIDYATESALVELSYSVCESLNVGLTFEQVLGASDGSGMDPYEVGYIVAGAVYDLCPQFTGDMDEFMNANGVTV